MSEPSLLGPSKTKILLLLRAENRTAGNVASRLRMQTSAARKHLEQLAILGLVAETFQGGTVGRPKKFYALTENGREMFPRSYDAFLNNLVAKLVEREGHEYTESMLKGIATDVAKSLDGQRPHSGERMKQVQTGLTQLGFEATLKRENGRVTVISRNCPIWKAALKQREVLCQGYHAELLKASLRGKKVDRQEWMVDGDSYCRHTVTLESRNVT